MITNKFLHNVAITGIGRSTPEVEVTNDEMSKIVDTSDEWISSRTGIKTRRIANKDETAASLATNAAIEALKSANLNVEDVDLILVASSLGEYLYPSTACQVQGALGATNAFAYDIVAACSGFAYGINTAECYIRSGMYKNILLIGVDMHSRYMDWEDRGTCVLFGDGAGAFVLQQSEDRDDIIASDLGADGTKAMELTVPLIQQKCPLVEQKEEDVKQIVYMNGREIYKFAVSVVPKSIQKALEKADMTIDDIDFLVPHQANMRIITAISDRLNIPEDKVLAYIDKFGNTSTASIPTVLTEAMSEGKLKPGSKLVLCGFGAGLTWGTVVVNWNVEG